MSEVRRAVRLSVSIYGAGGHTAVNSGFSGLAGFNL